MADRSFGWKIRHFFTPRAAALDFAGEVGLLLRDQYSIHPHIIRRWRTEPGLVEDMRCYLADGCSAAETAESVNELIQDLSIEYRQHIEDMFSAVEQKDS